MKITIDFIEHNDQRYNTVGDWTITDSGDLEIRVSKLGTVSRPSIAEYLIAIHELVEAVFCTLNGVTPKMVDNWDLGDRWEARGFSEPGADVLAPYHNEHMLAEIVERMLAQFYGLEWRTYGQMVERAEKSYRSP